VRQHGQEYHRGISGLPQQQPVTSSSSARLVASWQGQEVTIWRIRGRSSESSEGRLHRLLARVSIKGDEAIADAALSQSGRLLAVSTVSETRVFELSTTNDPGDSLSIQKVEIETPLPGGYSVQISSDQKWLSLLTPSNNILVYRLGENEVGTQISKQPFRLDRIKRGADSTSLQSYRRTISRQQFSPGSKVLVVADLSGFIDCWKLEGEEDTSAPDADMQEADDAASESSSSSDDDDEEVEFRSYGQYWRRMDSSKTLPQLDSAALVLSFRPERKIKQIEQNGVKGKSVNGVHGNNLDDATEEDDVEGADSIERPNESYELVVLTASHRLYEFDLVAGKFTDWSRRNTSDRLPTAFQKLKDRAMGCYWHNTADAQRLYFYGSSWLFMFDVLQDFEADVESDASDKENRLLERPRKRKWEGESGAGDRIRDEDYVGFRPSLQTTTQNGEPVKKKKKKVEQEQQPQSSSAKEEVDDDEEEEEEDQIIPGGSLRLTQVPEAGSDKDVDGGVGGKRPRRTWHSFAYRPILAVVPLQQTADYIETVLVERPLWELDLPPRLAGPHDKAG
jgi:U3 small nucleolar RNA-associated protein 4